jgi:hypothetical protein
MTRLDGTNPHFRFICSPGKSSAAREQRLLENGFCPTSVALAPQFHRRFMQELSASMPRCFASRERA